MATPNVHLGGLESLVPTGNILGSVLLGPLRRELTAQRRHMCQLAGQARSTLTRNAILTSRRIRQLPRATLMIGTSQDGRLTNFFPPLRRYVAGMFSAELRPSDTKDQARAFSKMLMEPCRSRSVDTQPSLAPMSKLPFKVPTPPFFTTWRISRLVMDSVELQSGLERTGIDLRLHDIIFSARTDRM